MMRILAVSHINNSKQAIYTVDNIYSWFPTSMRNFNVCIKYGILVTCKPTISLRVAT